MRTGTRRRAAVALLVLVALAAVEITGLVLVTRAIGLAWALALVLAGALLGTWLLRREGARAWRRFRAAAQAGRPPGGEVSRGVVGLVAGLLLVVPGFLTDLAGLLLLAPPVRAGAVRLSQRFAERRLSGAVASDLFGPRRVRVDVRADGSGQPGADEVIEGEIID
jgi:UPF0716 protein FxsA